MKGVKSALAIGNIGKEKRKIYIDEGYSSTKDFFENHKKKNEHVAQEEDNPNDKEGNNVEENPDNSKENPDNSKDSNENENKN